MKDGNFMQRNPKLGLCFFCIVPVIIVVDFIRALFYTVSDNWNNIKYVFNREFTNPKEYIKGFKEQLEIVKNQNKESK